MDNDNARVAFAQFIDSAPEKSETMIQAIEALVQKQGKKIVPKHFIQV